MFYARLSEKLHSMLFRYYMVQPTKTVNSVMETVACSFLHANYEGVSGIYLPQTSVCKAAYFSSLEHAI